MAPATTTNPTVATPQAGQGWLPRASPGGGRSTTTLLEPACGGLPTLSERNGPIVFNGARG